MSRSTRRAVARGHNVHDYHCEEYLGHNDVPKGVDIYEERCLICAPYSEEEADRLLMAQGVDN